MNPHAVTLTSHRITVLLIDDQAIISEAVQRMLTGENDIAFYYCQDPTQAIKLANQIGPTVILQDLVMPEMDGLTLLRYFRVNPATREVPLIVLSSKEDPAIKAEAFALGANDYVVKLPDRLELLARVRHHSKGYINLLERNEAYNALLESRQQLEIRNRFIRETFGRYVSDEVVEKILETPGGLNIGGEKREVTVLMSDLRGFTTTSERLPAEDVVAMLNRYLESMTEIILRYRGTINEFIGDAIVVVFGAPTTYPDDPPRAVACALEMQQAMAEVNAWNRQDGYPELTMGIGINTGEVIVGNIGSKKRTKYDVIGHNVNLASRIESYTVGGQVFVSQTTLAACGDLLRIDGHLEVMPKGMTQPTVIYDIGGIGGDFNIFLPAKSPLEFTPLPRPLAVRFVILEGKHGGEDVHAGSLIGLAGERAAEIQGERNCRPLTNLKLSLLDGPQGPVAAEVYAKVVEIAGEQPPVFRVSFTSVSPAAEELLHRLRAGMLAAAKPGRAP